MKGTKFTKGEWIADNNTVYSLHDVPWGNGTIKSNRFYASIYGDASNVEPEELKQEMKANAKLIATAPELLQSCIDLANEFRHQLINHAMDLDVDEETAIAYAESFDIWKDAQKAIKKATS